jgi:hypothetical protein
MFMPPSYGAALSFDESRVTVTFTERGLAAFVAAVLARPLWIASCSPEYVRPTVGPRQPHSALNWLAAVLAARGAREPVLEGAINLYFVSRWPLAIAATIVLGISLSSRRWARPVLYIALSAVALIQLLSSVFFVFASTQVVVVFRELLSTS